jgi:hypothetical protein
MSKLQDSIVGWERFKLFDEIIGCADMTSGVLICLIDCARAAVADMMCMYIVYLLVDVSLKYFDGCFLKDFDGFFLIDLF